MDDQRYRRLLQRMLVEQAEVLYDRHSSVGLVYELANSQGKPRLSLLCPPFDSDEWFRGAKSMMEEIQELTVWVSDPGNTYRVARQLRPGFIGIALVANARWHPASMCNLADVEQEMLLGSLLMLDGTEVFAIYHLGTKVTTFPIDDGKPVWDFEGLRQLMYSLDDVQGQIDQSDENWQLVSVVVGVMPLTSDTVALPEQAQAVRSPSHATP